MYRYKITEKAGRMVAGHVNTGVGSDLILTAEQAADALAVGHLAELPVSRGGSAPDGAAETPPQGGDGGGGGKSPEKDVKADGAAKKADGAGEGDQGGKDAK